MGTAAGWGGNARRDAVYYPVFPKKNDGQTAYQLTLKDAPVDGFWSVTIYDEKGFMFENIQFGGDPKSADNFLAIKPGWNYVLWL